MRCGERSEILLTGFSQLTRSHVLCALDGLIRTPTV
jgi:hypothetical protein